MRVASAAPASASSISARTSAASCLELAGLGRVVGDVALGVAHGARLQRGVKADLGAVADDQLGRAAADVDDERPAAGVALGDGAEVGQPRLLGAVEDLGVEREALAQLGEEHRRVLASRTALVAIATTARRRAPRRSRCRRRPRRRRPRSPPPRAGRRCRRRGRAGSRSSGARARGRRPSSTSATSSRVEFVPMSTTATLNRIAADASRALGVAPASGSDAR